MCVAALPIIAESWSGLALINIGLTVGSSEATTTVTCEVVSAIYARTVVLTQAAVTSAVVATCTVRALTHPVTSSTVQLTGASIQTRAG